MVAKVGGNYFVFLKEKFSQPRIQFIVRILYQRSERNLNIHQILSFDIYIHFFKNIL